jgi:upstream activation factor subunit UAF30
MQESDNLQPDEMLADILGSKPRSRGDILKDFWQYIRTEGLDDSSKRVVKTDDKLKLVLGDEKTVSIFLIGGLVEKHLS